MEVATDLHGHTRFSDGRTTPEEYVEFRRSLGMRLIAVSDHDVFTAVPAAARAAARAGLVLLPAMEVTSFLHFGEDRREQVHILAYYPPSHAHPSRLARTAMHARGKLVLARWKAFVLDWLAGLSEDDRLSLDPEGALAGLSEEDFPALQPLIDRIWHHRRELFEPFRTHHVLFWERDRELFGWSPEEAIEAIRADGAVDVVAHAGRYRDKDRTRKVLDYATGVEVYTSRHKPEVAQGFLDFAEQTGKHWTASSDDHQNARYIRPPRGTPRRTAERLLARPLTDEEARQARS